jgi:DNA-binding NarL/FixJ family response regulator
MAMEKAIRVLVANRPRLLREVLVTTLEDQPWIEVVGEASENDDLSNLVDKSSPDLLIIALDDPAKRPPICDALLQTHPNLWIIAVAPDKNCSMRYWASFEIHSDDVESSEEGFLRVVRRLADGISRASRVS